MVQFETETRDCTRAETVLFHDHALRTKGDAGRSGARRSGNRFQRAVGSCLRADHHCARLRAGARRSGHRRADHQSDDRAPVLRRPRARRHDDSERQCLLRSRHSPRGEGKRLRPARRRLVEAAVRRGAECGRFAIRCRRAASRRRRRRRSRPPSRNRSESLARGVSPMHEAIKGYPDEVDEVGGVHDEGRDDGDGRISGRDSGRARPAPRRTHGAGERTGRSNIGSRRSTRRLRWPSCS